MTTKERVEAKRKVLEDQRKIKVYDTIVHYTKTTLIVTAVILLIGIGGQC